MKKFIALLLIIVTLFSYTACSKSEENAEKIEPQISQMKAICELAVMECYYHTVAKFTKEDASGALWWKKDKHFWVEYSGIVKLGIDISLLDIKIKEDQVIIAIPEAKVLGCKVDSASLNKNSFIVDKSSAKIEAEDEIKAFDEAQKRLEEISTNDKALLAGAQQRAQSLLEDYIYNIGVAVGKEYSIKWIYLDGNGNPSNSISFSESDDTSSST